MVFEMLHLYLRFTISECKKNNGLIIKKITAVKLLFNHKNSHLDDLKDKRNYNFPYSRDSSQFLFINNLIDNEFTIWTTSYGPCDMDHMAPAYVIMSTKSGYLRSKLLESFGRKYNITAVLANINRSCLAISLKPKVNNRHMDY